MQSNTNCREADTSLELSDAIENHELNADSRDSSDTRDTLAATLLHCNDENDLSKLETSESLALSTDEHLNPDESVVSPGSDAFGWLKIVNDATPDLSGDAWLSKRDAPALPLPPAVLEPESHKHDWDASAPETFSGLRWPSPVSDLNGEYDEFSEERKIPRKIGQRFGELPPAPPQMVRASRLPYIAAAGFSVFIAGSAAFYLAATEPSTEVKTAEPPRVESPIAAGQSDSDAARSAAEKPRQELTVAKKGGFERPKAVPQSAVAEVPAATRTSENAGGWATKPEEPAKQAELTAKVPVQLETWSDTVETFKQFVASEAHQSLSKDAENARLTEKLDVWQKKPN